MMAVTTPATGTSRRDFLRQLFLSAGALAGTPVLLGCGGGGSADASAAAAPREAPQQRRSRFASIGPLGEPDANGLRLPAGFSSRVLAVSGEPVPGTLHPWHAFPDGGATFKTADGGWVYVSNSEVPGGLGGAGALRFSARGEIVEAYTLLSGTRTNCAGGGTPWNTWLSCEEVEDGQVYECDPLTRRPALARPALGRFAHEAVAVDPQRRVLYLTEDTGDGRFYRFVPSASDWPRQAARPALEEGRLQVLRYADLAPGTVPDGFDVQAAHRVVWEDVANPALAQAPVRATLGNAAPGTRFRGGEGLWFLGGIVYFSTKGDNRIWAYDASNEKLQAIYDFGSRAESDRILSGVDNLTVSEFGDVLVAEDGGDMQVCVLLPDRRVLPLLQATDLQAGTKAASEITGVAFSPDGTRLYFSAQRNGRLGVAGPGITYEVTLPFSACPSGLGCQAA